MFHLGFRSAAKTIAALESQISFHVRGSKGKWGQKGPNAALLIFLYNGALMWRTRMVDSPVSSSEDKRLPAKGQLTLASALLAVSL